MTLSPELTEQVMTQGLDALPGLLQAVINCAMEFERERHLRAGRFERSTEREGYANGFKPKTVKTRVGAITFAIPQVREGGFYPKSLEKGTRSERALKLAFAEMVIQGVSTRNVTRVSQVTKLTSFFESKRKRPAFSDPILGVKAH